MTKKIIRMMLCSILIAGCAKLVEPGSSLSPIAVPSIAAPNPLPTPDFESPLPAPFDSPLLTPDMPSPIATPASNIEDQKLIESAKNDLVVRLKVFIDQIEVIDYKSIDWPDASAGCPKKGVFYIQTITPGYQIRLGYNGQAYEYDGRNGELPVLCEK